jgi:C-terminal processing protease CtpA/Prc
MHWQSFIRAAGVVLAAANSFGQAATHLSTDEVTETRTVLDDMHDAMRDHYYPRGKIGNDFDSRCAETRKALANAADHNEAYALIADALMSVDSRLRFYPPLRSARADYSWKWRLIGNAAYVTQIDQVGDATKQGLKLGDLILSLEDQVPDRNNYQQLQYLFNTLAPRPGLRVLVQSPGQEPRWMAIATTLRPQRKIRSSGSPSSFWTAWELSESDKRHRDEFYDLKPHLHHTGAIAIWRAIELQSDLGSVANGLKEIKPAGALVLDLRGLYVRRHETILRLLDGLFTSSFDAGTIKRDRSLDDKLQVRGGPDAFQGMVLVLVDAQTAAYAEVLARIIQQKQRGVIIGDRTMGRVLEETAVQHTRGTINSFTAARVLVPTGEVIMADGVPLDAKGVIPDLLLLPKPADLEARRDIVLAKALAMLKQKSSPEEAYRIVRLPSEDDDDNE